MTAHAVLHEAKRADSRRKHERAAATVKRLLNSGSRVSFARVAAKPTSQPGWSTTPPN